MKMLNIFAIETLQNIPFVLGAVIGLFWWHNGSLWLGMGGFILGSLGCAWLILSFESYKVRWTTLVIEHFPPASLQYWRKLLAMTAAFSIGLFLICAYLEQPWANWQTDLLIVTSLAVAISLAEVLLSSAKKVPRLRILTHTISFIVAGIVILPMLRLAMWTSATLWGSFFWAAPVALAMSLLIAIVDYAPFLKKE